jgi:hypothetical protein
MTVMVSPQLAGWVEIALVVASLIGFVALISSPDIVPDKATRTRIGVVSAVLVAGALLIAQPLGAWYYDTAPLCDWFGWWSYC